VAVGVFFLLQALLGVNPQLRPVQLVLGPFAIVYGLWPRLILSAQGVTVVNLRPHTIAWEDITAVEVSRSRWNMISLVLHPSADERPVRSFAIRGSASGLLSSHDLVTGLAAQIEDERRRRIGAAARAPAPA